MRHLALLLTIAAAASADLLPNPGPERELVIAGLGSHPGYRFALVDRHVPHISPSAYIGLGSEDAARKRDQYRAMERVLQVVALRDGLRLPPTPFTTHHDLYAVPADRAFPPPLTAEWLAQNAVARLLDAPGFRGPPDYSEGRGRSGGSETAELVIAVSPDPLRIEVRDQVFGPIARANRELGGPGRLELGLISMFVVAVAGLVMRRRARRT